MQSVTTCLAGMSEHGGGPGRVHDEPAVTETPVSLQDFGGFVGAALHACAEREDVPGGVE